MKDRKISALILLGISVALGVAIMVTGQDAPPADAAKAQEGAAVEPEAAKAQSAVAEPSPIPLAVEQEQGKIEEVVFEEEEIVIPAPPEHDTPPSSRISITLYDVELLDVVKMFTTISRANIIATPSNLQGRVTVNLTDVDWQPALESILDMHSLALVEKAPGSEVFSIVLKTDGPEPLIVKTFSLSYAQVSNTVSVVSSMLAPTGSVQPFPARNALVVRTTSANMREIEQIIEQIDVLRKQVFIEAKFMELSDSAIKDLGINWQGLQSLQLGASNLKMNYKDDKNWDKTRTDRLQAKDSRTLNDVVDQRYDMDGRQYEEVSITYEEMPPNSGRYISHEERQPTRHILDTVDKSYSVSKDIQDSYVGAIADMRTAVLSATDFNVILSALKQTDGVQVVSNPKIIVANEEPAIIHIGQEERPFISTITPATETSAPIVTYNPGQPVQFGVKLTVIPTVNTESNITVKIEPELTRFVRDAQAPNGQTYPIISKKTIKTVFSLESGKTVAIGGLTETEERDATSTVPLLGSIPIIGKYLFSHQHMEKSQKETIIFVTLGLANPEMVSGNDGLPEETELAKRRVMRDQIQRIERENELEKEQETVDAKMEKMQKQNKVRDALRRNR